MLPMFVKHGCLEIIHSQPKIPKELNMSLILVSFQIIK